MFHNISYANRFAAAHPCCRRLPGTWFDGRAFDACQAPFGAAGIRSTPKQARGALVTSKVRKLEPRRAPARLDTPTDLSSEAVREVSAALNGLLADTFAL